MIQSQELRFRQISIGWEHPTILVQFDQAIEPGSVCHAPLVFCKSATRHALFNWRYGIRKGEEMLGLCQF